MLYFEYSHSSNIALEQGKDNCSLPWNHARFALGLYNQCWVAACFKLLVWPFFFLNCFLSVTKEVRCSVTATNKRDVSAWREGRKGLTRVCTKTLRRYGGYASGSWSIHAGNQGMVRRQGGSLGISDLCIQHSARRQSATGLSRRCRRQGIFYASIADIRSCWSSWYLLGICVRRLSGSDRKEWWRFSPTSTKSTENGVHWRLNKLESLERAVRLAIYAFPRAYYTFWY